MCMVLQCVFSRAIIVDDFDIKMKQRAVIHFFVQKGKSLKETIDELYSAPTVYWRYKAYWEGMQSFTLQKLSERLVSQITQGNVNMISAMIRKDWHLTVWDLEHITFLVDHSPCSYTKFLNVIMCHRRGYWIYSHVNKLWLVSKFVKNSSRHFRSNEICLRK